MDELIKNLVGILVGILTAVNTSILWSIRDLVKKHEQTLYGAAGDGGHQGELKEIKDRVHKTASMVTAHEFRLAVLEEKQEGDGA